MNNTDPPDSGKKGIKSYFRVLPIIRLKVVRPTEKNLILFFTILIAITGMVVMLVAQKNFSNKTAEKIVCAKLPEDSNVLIEQKKYQEAYTALNIHTGECGEPRLVRVDDSNKDNQNVDRLVFNASLAKAAYLSGDKERAKVISEQGLELSQEMSPEERSRVPNQADNVLTLIRIKNGTYVHDGVKP